MNAIASQIVNRLSSMLASDLERYAKNRVASGQLGFGFKSDDRLTGQKTFGWKEELHPRAADGKFATEENKGEKAEEPENQAQVEEKPEDKPAEKTDREKLIEKAEKWSTPGDNYDRQIRNHLTRLKSVMERGFDETSVGYHERELQQAVDAKEAREAQATSEPEVDEEEADSEPPFDPMQAVKVSADSIDRLRKQDVQRVIEWTPEEHRGAVADYISKERPDLADEVSEVVGELNGGEEPQAQAEEPAEPERKSTYINGDRVEYTGQMVDGMHEYEIMEGHKKGQIGATARGPDGSDPYADRSRKEWKEMQAGFARLHQKPEDAAKAKQEETTEEEPVAQSAAEPADENGRDSFSPGSIRPDDNFKRGQWVSGHISKDSSHHGYITGISHANGKAKIGNVWFNFGQVYNPTEKSPEEIDEADRKRKSVPLSEAIAKVNAKGDPDGILTDADKVPGSDPASDSRSAIDKLADHQEKIRSGNATAAEVREWHAWASSPETTEEIRQHLNGKTIAQLKAMGAGSYWSKTKAEFVEDGLRKMQEQYHVKQMLSHGFGKGEREKALKDSIANQTDDDIKDFADRVKKSTDERKARIEQITKAIKDPQTLEDFKTRQQFAKDKTLTPEMQERYDELVGTTRRASEKAQAETVAPVQGVSGVTAQVKEGFNAKKGKPTHVVTLDQRVEKDKYYELNAAAKKLGGYYSNFRGAGAIPGFQFDTPEAAKKFQDLVHGQKVDATPEVESRAEEKATSQADTLRERAESIKQAAEEELSKDRKTNTERRAESAAHIDARNRQKVAQAETMAKVADGIASGNLKHLGGVKAATHVDELTRALNRAKQNTIRQKENDPEYMRTRSWSQRDSEWQRDATIDDVANAEYPHPRLHANTVREISTELAKVPGLKQAAATLGKHAKGSSDRIVTLDTEKDIDALRQVATKLKGHPNRSLKWLGEKAAGELESYNRFQQMGIKSLPELRAALREYHGLKTSAPGEDPIKAAERRLVGRKIDGFFPTPRSVVESMLDKADIKPGMSVLEPSAGKGDILDAVKDRHGASVTTEAIEPHGDLRDILSKKGHNVQGRDFLEHKGQYDRIVMNPPFENSQDIAHVKHAYEQLAPGGKLVAVVSAGGGKKRDEFDDWVNGKDGEIEALPQGSFASAEAFRQTGVNTRLVTISKPAAPVKYSMAEQITDGIRDRIVDRISMMFHRPEQYAKTRTAPGQMSFGFVTKGTQRSMQWKEEEHPRDAEGKFATENGNTAKAEEPAKEPEEPEALADDDQAEDAPADLASEAEEAFAEDMDDSDPRQEAEEQFEKDVKSENVYAFARKSAIPNMGEDVLGSARHKRNQWKGLEEAEKDGTADELVTRDKLLKNEPHGLAMYADRNPMTAMAMHYAMRAIPETPGYKSGTVGPKEREQYLELYRLMKDKARELAEEQPDPRKAIASLWSELAVKAKEFRGQSSSMPYTGTDRHNQTANLISSMSTAFETYRSRPKLNTILGKTMAFVAQAAKSVPEMRDNSLDFEERAAAFRIVGTAAISIMSGKSLPAAFGATSKRAKAGFSELAQYVGSAERKGGKDVSEHTKTGEKAAKHLGDSYGLRAVQWGNSVSEEERRHHAIKAVEAFTDLADVLGMKPEDVSLGGNIALAVGSSGKAGSAATYFPGRKLINLNRSSGVGSLAHEWGHAFDHSIAGFTATGMGYEDYSRSSNGAYSSTDHRAYHPAMKGLREAMESSGYKKRLIKELQGNVNLGLMTANKGNKYWLSDPEMFARSFERYIQEKLSGKGQYNTYLSGVKEDAELWPTAEEIEHMAPHFDKLFATFRKQKYGSEEPQKFSRAHLEQSIRMILEGVTEDYAKHKSAPGQLGFGFISKGGQHSIKWDESKHPRAEDGKFGHGSGNSSNTAETEPEKDSQTDEMRVEPQAAPADELSPEDDYKANGTRAKAFKNWFGDWENDPANSSKVVDPETGEPQETGPIDGKGSKVVKDGVPVNVYHGTASGGFEAFDKSKLADPEGLLFGPGFYFTEDQSVAQEYTEKGDAKIEWALNNPLNDEQETRDGVAGILEKAVADMRSSRKEIFGEDSYEQQVNEGRFADEKRLERAAKALRDWKPLLQSMAPLLQEDDFGTNELARWKLDSLEGLFTKKNFAEVKQVYLNIRKPFDADNGGADLNSLPEEMRDDIKRSREYYGSSYRNSQVTSGEKAARFRLEANKAHEDFVKSGGKNVTIQDARDMEKMTGNPSRRRLLGDVTDEQLDLWNKYERAKLSEEDYQKTSNRYAKKVRELNRPIVQYDELVAHFKYKAKVQEFLAQQGFDGITHTGGGRVGDKAHRVWIAFEPNQIKATDNKGTFDPSDNRMKYRNEGERWITIGGGPKGEDGKRNPHGFPVKIDGDGRIVASRVSGLQGKLISGVKDHFAEMRSTAESHDHARRSARAHGAKPSEVRKLMPQAHQFIKDQVALRETARTHARNLSKLNSGVIAKIENAHRDWSTVDGFDSVARDVAIAHPELGFDPDDTDTPGKVWELIREGKEAIPTKDSREVAELAAQWAKHSGTTKTKEVHPEDSLEFSRSRSGETAERYAFQESQHPRDEGGKFMTAGQAATAGKSYGEWDGAISDAFRKGEINDDHPAWKSIQVETAPTIDEYNEAKKRLGTHVRTMHSGEMGKVTAIADDAKSVTVTHADGKTSTHRPDMLHDLGADVTRRLQSAGHLPIDKHAAYLGQALAKEAIENGENIGVTMKRHGISPTATAIRAAIAENVEKLKAVPAPEKKPEKKLTAVAGMQQGLFGGGERAGGQKSLFNVVHPTSKAKPTGSSEPKPTGRMAEFLAKKDTVSPADLAVPLAPPSLPGQKKLFSRGQSEDFDEAEHPRNESGQFIEKDGDDSGRVKMRQAKAGGEVSEVDGQHYKGGRWMPVHGLYSGQEKPEKKPKQEGDSGPVFASESSKGPVMARQLSPEQVEAERARQQEQKDWDSIQAGPLGQLLHLGDEPHNIRHTHGDIRKWAELFESGDITTDSLEDATDYARDQVQQIEEAKSAMTAEDWDYYSGWINEHAERDRSDYAPRQIKKLLNANPAITDARSWLSTLMEARQDIDTLKEINDRLAGV